MLKLGRARNLFDSVFRGAALTAPLGRLVSLTRGGRADVGRGGAAFLPYIIRTPGVPNIFRLPMA